MFCLYIQGEGLSLAIYSSGWEKMWNKGTRSTLLIILVRATRPVVLKTMFRNICLDALTDVSTSCVTGNLYTFLLGKEIVKREGLRHRWPHYAGSNMQILSRCSHSPLT